MERELECLKDQVLEILSHSHNMLASEIGKEYLEKHGQELVPQDYGCESLADLVTKMAIEFGSIELTRVDESLRINITKVIF